MKKITALILALVLMISLIPTSFAWSGYPNSLNLSGKSYVYVGDVVRWTSTPYPSYTNPWVQWRSGYPAVATVDQNGYITAHRAGQAHITAIAANGVKKTVTLTVYNRPGIPAEVKTAGKSFVYVGDNVKWTASVYPSTANQWIEWKSGYPAVATVDKNGVVTAHRAGQAHITATAANGVKKTVTLTVYNRPSGIAPTSTVSNSGLNVLSAVGEWLINTGRNLFQIQIASADPSTNTITYRYKYCEVPHGSYSSDNDPYKIIKTLKYGEYEKINFEYVKYNDQDPFLRTNYIFDQCAYPYDSITLLIKVDGKLYDGYSLAGYTQPFTKLS